MPEAIVRHVYPTVIPPVTTRYSVTGGNGQPIQLVADVDKPGVLKCYSTDQYGQRGWFDLPAGGGGGGTWGSITGTLSAQTDLWTALSLKVPTSRTLTINGTAYDLSADRSWTVTTGVAWGAITGTLSAQTNLQSALNALVPTTRQLTIAGTTFDLSADRTWTVDFSSLTGNWTLAQGPSLTASTLLGRGASGAGVPQDIILGTNLSMSGTTLNASTSGLVSNLTFGLKRNAGISVGKLPGYWTCDFSGTISAWNITVDAGTITLKIWKIASGTAHPTNANSINTSGISLSSGTSVHSTSLGDFTTLAVTYGDIFAVEVVTVSGVFDLGGSVEITPLLTLMSMTMDID